MYSMPPRADESRALVLSNNDFDTANGVLIGKRTCADAEDGPVTLFPLGAPVMDARCDMHSPNGPWLTFQRRVATTDFDKDWKAYKEGFGDRSKSFWLGNDNIHEMTKDGASLRVDLCTLPEGWNFRELAKSNSRVHDGWIHSINSRRSVCMRKLSVQYD